MQPRLLSEPLRLAGAPLLRLQADDRLVRLARDGHEPAWAVLVQRHQPALHRHCAKLVGAHRAEDVVQQTFVNAHRALGDGVVPDVTAAWLTTIAHRLALNVLRDGHPVEELDERTPVAGTDPGETVVVREQLRRTLAAIAALPAKQRDALLLHEVEGRPHDEVALALGVSPGAARNHLMRARASLRGAVTVVTPYGLAARAALWLAEQPEAGRLVAAGVGAGATGVAAKVAVGVVAVGAAIGGTTLGVREVAGPPRSADAAPAEIARDTAEAPTGTVARGRPAVVAVPVSRTSPAAGGSERRTSTTDGRSRRPAQQSGSPARVSGSPAAAAPGPSSGSGPGSGSGSPEHEPESDDHGSSGSSGSSGGSGSSGSGSGSKESVRAPDDEPSDGGSGSSSPGEVEREAEATEQESHTSGSGSPESSGSSGSGSSGSSGAGPAPAPEDPPDDERDGDDHDADERD